MYSNSSGRFMEQCRFYHFLLSANKEFAMSACLVIKIPRLKLSKRGNPHITKKKPLKPLKN